jgi:hypothetical protein
MKTEVIISVAFTNRQAVSLFDHTGEPRNNIYTDGYGFLRNRPTIWELKAVSEAARTVGWVCLHFFAWHDNADLFFSNIADLSKALNVTSIPSSHPELLRLAMAVSVCVRFGLSDQMGREPSLRRL